MGLLDKAKGLADQAMTKADQALNSATTGGGNAQVDRYLRDLGVLAYLEANGRAPADLAEQRERCMTGLSQLEATGPLDLQLTSMAPPAPGAAAGSPPPPPGAAGSAPPPPAPGAGDQGSPGSVPPPPPPGSVAPPPPPQGG